LLDQAQPERSAALAGMIFMAKTKQTARKNIEKYLLMFLRFHYISSLTQNKQPV